MRNTQPPSPWREVTTAVNALPPGGRTQNAIGKRYQQVLQYDDQSRGPLSEKEKTLLKKAVEDLDSGTDRWWFVAARYAELRKGDADTREMGKVGVKKWWGVVKSEEGESAGGTPKKMGNGKKR